MAAESPEAAELAALKLLQDDEWLAGLKEFAKPTDPTPKVYFEEIVEVDKNIEQSGATGFSLYLM
ncbi:MAG: hypothetical protein WA979_04680 [Pacificimonas sp.]